jgi:bacterial/archaeal transporter family-2 protein
VPTSGIGEGGDHRVRERAAPTLAIASAAGVCSAIQPKVNAVLGERLGSALVASLLNFAVALAVTLVAVSLRPGTRRTLRRLRTWDVPWWTLTAGLGGAVVVLAGAVAVETIGVAIFTVAFFAGQIVVGLVVDRLGVSPGGKRPITAPRVQAVGLAVVAVVLAQWGRPLGDAAPALVAFAVAGGAAVAFQSAFNARIASSTGDPVAATAVNVAVGTVTLASIVFVLAAAGRLGAPRWPTEPWLYTGGALGAGIVLALAVATAAIGVLRTTLTMLGAQLIAAFLVDWAIQEEPPSAGVIAGGLLITAAVALVRRPATVEGAPGQGSRADGSAA